MWTCYSRAFAPGGAVGNLNKFYLMGRVARAPESTGEGQQRVVTLAITPGTAQRAPRGGPVEPIVLEAGGPQTESAQQLRVGQGVFLRGQLRQETRGESLVLVARVQAIELLAEPRRKPRPPREGGGEVDATESGEGQTSGKRPRRRRRGRGRGRERGERPAGEGAPAEGAAPAAATPTPERPTLPPHQPVVQAPVEPVKPPADPTLENDMPF
jgi:single-stranded DNA-binding protein